MEKIKTFVTRPVFSVGSYSVSIGAILLVLVLAYFAWKMGKK